MFLVSFIGFAPFCAYFISIKSNLYHSHNFLRKLKGLFDVDNNCDHQIKSFPQDHTPQPLDTTDLEPEL